MGHAAQLRHTRALLNADTSHPFRIFFFLPTERERTRAHAGRSPHSPPQLPQLVRVSRFPPPPRGLTPCTASIRCTGGRSPSACTARAGGTRARLPRARAPPGDKKKKKAVASVTASAVGRTGTRRAWAARQPLAHPSELTHLLEVPLERLESLGLQGTRASRVSVCPPPLATANRKLLRRAAPAPRVHARMRTCNASSSPSPFSGLASAISPPSLLARARAAPAGAARARSARHRRCVRARAPARGPGTRPGNEPLLARRSPRSRPSPRRHSGVI